MGSHAAFIGSIPEAYDRYLGPLLFEPYAVDLAARVRVAPPAAVLELACGTGILTRHLRRTLPAGVALTATDLNEPMLAYARARVSDSGIQWQTADAQSLPFPDRSFTAVACQFGVMFVPDKALTFREVRRVLMPGGSFSFNVWCSLAENPFGRTARTSMSRFFATDQPTFYDTPYGFHDQSVIRGLLGSAGFEIGFCEVVELQASSPSALEAARGAVTGNPVLKDIQERATAPVDVIIEAVAAALAAEGGAAPLTLPMRALVVVARAV